MIYPLRLQSTARWTRDSAPGSRVVWMREMRTNKRHSGNPLAISPRGPSPGPDVGRRPASAVERWLLGEMLRSLGNPTVALVPWNGAAVTCPGGGQPQIRLHLRDPGALLRLALDPAFQFGELYSCGRIEVEGDLVALIASIFAAQGLRQGIRSRLLSLVHAPRSNLLGKSTANIHHHYDIGNDFYASGSTTNCSTPVRTSRRRPSGWSRPRWRRWTMSAASSGCDPAKRWSKRVAAGARWHCIWRASYGVRVRAYNSRQRAGRLCPAASPRRGAGCPCRVRRGRLPGDRGRLRRVRFRWHAGARGASTTTATRAR